MRETPWQTLSASLASNVSSKTLCACRHAPQALGVPKVALLFLAKENIWLHESWRLWFQSASGVLPLRSLQKHGCSRSTVTLPEACRGTIHLLSERWHASQALHGKTHIGCLCHCKYRHTLLFRSPLQDEEF